MSKRSNSTTEILCEKLGEVQIQGTSRRTRIAIAIDTDLFPTDEHTITINMLPDDVLLDIFDLFVIDYDDGQYRFSPVCTWHGLVHVCRRWRQLVLGSPGRFNLLIVCTHGSPLREILDCWPPFPIVIRFDEYYRTLTLVDEDSIFAALEHRDRVRQIDLCLTGPQFDRVATAMQKPFPTLTHLYLRPRDDQDLEIDDQLNDRPSALASGFLGGSAPRLTSIFMAGIPFPALPALLSSTSDLLHLQLRIIPEDGFISPEAMVTCLGALTKLEVFHVEYPDVPHLDQLFVPPITRTLLPSLTNIVLIATSEYLVEFFSRIDCPQLKDTCISYTDLPFDFQISQFFDFIDRSNNPEIALCKHADLIFSASADVYFSISSRHHIALHPINLYIACREGIGRQLLSISQLLRQQVVMRSRVVHLNLTQSKANEDRHDGEWLHFLRQFPAVRTLYACPESARGVALALEDMTGGMVAEVLPVLDLIYLDDQPVSSIEKFLTARRLSGRPVTKIDTEAEFDERIESYVSP